MSRYVDIEPIITSHTNTEYKVSDISFAEVLYAPSIDIVRCEECKHEPICNHSVQHTTHDAHSVTIASKTVEWCSYGEREDE